MHRVGAGLDEPRERAGGGQSSRALRQQVLAAVGLVPDGEVLDRRQRHERARRRIRAGIAPGDDSAELAVEVGVQRRVARRLARVGPARRVDEREQALRSDRGRLLGHRVRVLEVVGPVGRVVGEGGPRRCDLLPGDVVAHDLGRQPAREWPRVRLLRGQQRIVLDAELQLGLRRHDADCRDQRRGQGRASRGKRDACPQHRRKAGRDGSPSRVLSRRVRRQRRRRPRCAGRRRPPWSPGTSAPCCGTASSRCRG